MNRNLRLVVVALAAVALLAGGAFVFAQGAPPQHPGGGRMGMGPGGRGGGPGFGGPGGLMLGRLNLTEEQRGKIQKLMDDKRASHQPAMEEMGKAQKALRDAIFADGGPDEQAIKVAQAHIQQLEPQLLQQRLEMEIEVAKILTPEQRKQLREMPVAGGGREGMGRGRGMMRHGPGF